MTVASAKRDAFSATSAAVDCARVCASRSRVQRPVGASLLANPPYPNFDLSRVVPVAKQYIGVPYVYGGANPGRLRLLGLHDVRLRAVRRRAAALVGTTGPIGPHITPSAALPGDLVVMDGGGHVGIYARQRMMIDAPYPGKTVGLHKIYNPAHWFVRFGI